MRDSSSTPTRTRRRIRAFPSKRRFGSFSSSVSRTLNRVRGRANRILEERANRAARRILERVSMTRHTSRLLRNPYSPIVLSSESLERSQIGNKRHERSQAAIQWPSFTNRRADSNAGHTVSRRNVMLRLSVGSLTSPRDLVGLAVRSTTNTIMSSLMTEALL